MITNIFNIFDPSTSENYSFNWISLIIIYILFPFSYWYLPNSYTNWFFLTQKKLFKEFKLLSKNTAYFLLLTISFFLYIIISNIYGLIPYTFTTTRQITINMSIAMPVLAGLGFFISNFNFKKILIHQVPHRTPFMLIPFIVIIEYIRNSIRPMTLSVRLIANMVAGHLLITLVSSAAKIIHILPFFLLIFAQIALVCLETAVAIIQAYVFRVLITLYFRELTE